MAAPLACGNSGNGYLYLVARYAEPTERQLKKRLDHVNAVAARLLPPRRFWFSPPEAEKASTVGRRAIGLDSWRLRMTSDAAHSRPSRQQSV